MKKLFALLLSLTMLVALAACGGDKAPSNQGGATTGGLTPDAITQRGVLRVGVKTDVPGFGLLDTATNTYSGIEIDLAYKIAEELGIDKVEFTPVTAATRGQLLDSGDIDIVAATFTINEERKASWNFTTPYYTDAVSLLVKNDSGIETFEDLAEIKIGVATGATSKAALIAAAAEANVTLDEDKNFEEYASYPEIKAALDAGRVQAFSVDGSILAGYVDNTNGDVISQVDVTCTLNRDNTQLSKTQTDPEGYYSIQVRQSESCTLSFSHANYVPQDKIVSSNTDIDDMNVTLRSQEE